MQATGFRPKRRFDTVRATPSSKGKKLRLTVVGASERFPVARRWLPVGLSLLAIVCLVTSFFKEWWSFTLYAPQYPKGLRLTVVLTGVSGDVKEIDTLNHYIGMASLSQAATLERAIAGHAVTLASVLIIGVMLLAGKRFGRLILIPAAMLPVGFIVDTLFWLYRFGHNLDPRAPLDMAPFTPTIFGNGTIGQFMTFARPEPGFWLALSTTVLCFIALALRQRVCATCPGRSRCGLVCPSAFIGQPSKAVPAE